MLLSVNLLSSCVLSRRMRQLHTFTPLVTVLKVIFFGSLFGHSITYRVPLLQQRLENNRRVPFSDANENKTSD